MTDRSIIDHIELHVNDQTTVEQVAAFIGRCEKNRVDETAKVLPNGQSDITLAAPVNVQELQTARLHKRIYTTIAAYVLAILWALWTIGLFMVIGG